MIIGVAAGAAVLIIWIAAMKLRGDGPAAAESPEARAALAEFAARALELDSVPHVLDYAAQAAHASFAAPRVVAFERSAHEGWDARVPTTGEALASVPAALRGLFGWFKHNTSIAVRADLGEPRFGAMRGPLGQIMQSYDLDVVMPLVHDGEILAALGLKLGRRPAPGDRETMRQFRLEATVACANVRLHREASHLISLAQEVDLASAVQQALVPDDTDGVVGSVAWAGHFRAATEAGSDFWAVYELAADRALLIIGDATGAGLAGSMVSAVVKSCSDAILDEHGDRVDPASLLGTLNRALWRPEKPIHMTAFAALFDRGKGVVRAANAGHPFPYRVTARGELGVLGGGGPVLGDEPQSRYKAHEHPLAEGDVVVFFTDGLVATRGPDGKPFGERRLQKLLAGLAGQGATAVRDKIAEQIAQYRGPAAMTDDEAMIVMKAGGAAGGPALAWQDGFAGR